MLPVTSSLREGIIVQYNDRMRSKLLAAVRQGAYTGLVFGLVLAALSTVFGTKPPSELGEAFHSGDWLGFLVLMLPRFAGAAVFGFVMGATAMLIRDTWLVHRG
jgi:hypothetical protein